MVQLLCVFISQRDEILNVSDRNEYSIMRLEQKEVLPTKLSADASDARHGFGIKTLLWFISVGGGAPEEWFAISSVIVRSASQCVKARFLRIWLLSILKPLQIISLYWFLYAVCLSRSIDDKSSKCYKIYIYVLECNCISVQFLISLSHTNCFPYRKQYGMFWRCNTRLYLTIKYLNSTSLF